MTAVLWHPGDPLMNSDEAYALDDTTPLSRPLRDPWATSGPDTKETT
jgi:hypothetical protein